MSAPRAKLTAERCPNPGECHCKGQRYTCRGCKRFVPYCFGADDELPNHCDDCWGRWQIENAAFKSQLTLVMDAAREP
jgi:hypothetical protein